MSIAKACGEFTGREFFEQLFASPAKQANDAAQNEQGLANQNTLQGEQYVNNQEQALRGAIQPGTVNPYLNAASSLSTAGYKVDPANVQMFGQPAATNGLPGAASTAQAMPGPRSVNAQGVASGIPPAQSNPFVGNPFVRAQPIARATAGAAG